ncbi:hypothetical protein EDD86DRAFT_206728 [Gorgonomyces haynaldii]|nr:hypothetical protein EDD86DRAFT_206728 [Gorgonomyces haynaldii]
MKAVCVQCGSRKWRKDDSGGYICQFGHQLGIHEETHEDNEATMHSQRRTVKKKKERLTSEEPEEAPPSFMSLIEFQTLLQQQMNWIIDTKKLPSQTKTVVRDLWLIYVAQSGVQIQLRAWHTLSMIALGMRVLDTPYQVGTILSWVLEGMPYFIRERRHEIQMRTIPNTKTIRKGLLHIFKICNLKPEMLFCLPSLAYHLMELLHMPSLVFDTRSLLSTAQTHFLLLRIAVSHSSVCSRAYSECCRSHACQNHFYQNTCTRSAIGDL